MPRLASIIKETRKLMIRLLQPPIPGHGAGRVSQLRQPVKLSRAVDIVKTHLGLSHVRLAKVICRDEGQIISITLCYKLLFFQVILLCVLP